MGKHFHDNKCGVVEIDKESNESAHHHFEQV